MKERNEEGKEGKRAYEKPLLTRHEKLTDITASTSPGNGT